MFSSLLSSCVQQFQHWISSFTKHSAVEISGNLCLSPKYPYLLTCILFFTIKLVKKHLQLLSAAFFPSSMRTKCKIMKWELVVSPSHRAANIYGLRWNYPTWSASALWICTSDVVRTAVTVEMDPVMSEWEEDCRLLYPLGVYASFLYSTHNLDIYYMWTNDTASILTLTI